MESQRPSVRLLLFSSIAVGLVVILGSGYLINQHRTINNMRRLSKESLSAMGDSLRMYISHLMLSGVSIKELEAEIQHIQKKNSHIMALQLIPAPVVTRQFELHPKRKINSVVSQALRSGTENAIFKNDRVIEYTFPIRAGQSCLGCHMVKKGSMLGVLDITFDASLVMKHFRDAQSSILNLTVAEALLLFILLVYLLTRFVFVPLGLLEEGAEALASGKRDVQVTEAPHSEIGRVIDAFNGMAARLQDTMDSLDQYIRDQSSQLGNMVKTSQLLGSEDNLGKMLAQMAEVMTESIKVTSCRILLRDSPDSECLHVSAFHPMRPINYKPSRQVCAPAVYPSLFSVLKDGRPHLIRAEEDVAESERDFLFYQDSQWVLCLPVIYQSEPLGVVIFNESRSLEREPIDDAKIRYAEAMIQELAAAISNIRLNNQIMAQMEDVVFAMAEAVDKKSPWTAGHAHRVAGYARSIAQALGWSEDECRDIYQAGLLHDIGKIGTPGTILNKEGKLDADEMEQLKRHSLDGSEIIGKIRSFTPLVPAIRNHHEYFDGTGYPDGLAGEAIPLPARMIAVADAFDAMVSDRPYRKGLTQEEAIHRLQAGAGSQFDPKIVDAFCGSLQGTQVPEQEMAMQPA